MTDENAAMTADADALMDAARRVRLNAHARFSNYLVGAAVLDETGAVHVGCNVENASYPEGICAEANAIGSMVSAGGTRIVAIAVAGGADASTEHPVASEVGACTPCGGCRQRILEFADAETAIFMSDDAGDMHTYSMRDLLPHAFRLDASD